MKKTIKTDYELWREMFASKEWIKPTKANLADYVPKKDTGMNHYMATIGKDSMGEYSLVAVCFNLDDAVGQIANKGVKGFMPIKKALRLFPKFFNKPKGFYK